MSLYNIPDKVQKLGVDIQSKQLKYHNYPVLVTKEFTFDSAHHLHNYAGKCMNLHGHTYRVIFGILGRTDERGISIDFGDIKRIWKDSIEPKLDHQYLNESLPPMNTTAENMVVWIFEQMSKHIEWDYKYCDVQLEWVRLYETPTSYVEFQKDWMDI
jgi:6-pyruvoyltetrahydropterin/6-carboxytetrahydropterin synthase